MSSMMSVPHTPSMPTTTSGGVWSPPAMTFSSSTSCAAMIEQPSRSTQIPSATFEPAVGSKNADEPIATIANTFIATPIQLCARNGGGILKSTRYAATKTMTLARTSWYTETLTYTSPIIAHVVPSRSVTAGAARMRSTRGVTGGSGVRPCVHTCSTTCSGSARPIATNMMNVAISGLVNLTVSPAEFSTSMSKSTFDASVAPVPLTSAVRNTRIAASPHVRCAAGGSAPAISWVIGDFAIQE